MKYKGTLYKSRWDRGTWGILGLIMLCCLWPLVFDDDGLIPVVICIVMLAMMIVFFISVYYRIDGNQLIVYTFFIPKAFPVEKITDIVLTKTYLSAPAASLTRRLAIRFSDKKILKSMDPLVISPARESEFIRQLLAINPEIKVSPDLGQYHS